MCTLSLPDSGLKTLAGLIVKYSCFEVLGCQQLCRISVTLWVVVVFWAPPRSTELVCMTWLAGIWVSGICNMYSMAEATGCC